MRQRIEIIVVADVDVDEWIPEQEKNEKLLSKAIANVTKGITGTKDVVECFIDYGDVV